MQEGAANEAWDSLVYALATVDMAGVTDNAILTIVLPDAAAPPQRAGKRIVRRRPKGRITF